MDWYALLYSVAGGLIGGLFTFIGVLMTIKHQERKSSEQKFESMQNKRPRLVIQDFKHSNSCREKKTDLDCIILPINKAEMINNEAVIDYPNECLNKSNLSCFEYKLRNEGSTIIRFFEIASNSPDKGMMLLDYKMMPFIVDNKFISIKSASDKMFIKPGDEVVIRIRFLKDKMPITTFTAPVSLYLEDVNNHHWCQPLFIPNKTIEDSIYISFDEYRNNTNESVVRDIFAGKKYN